MKLIDKKQQQQTVLPPANKINKNKINRMAHNGFLLNIYSWYVLIQSSLLLFFLFLLYHFKKAMKIMLFNTKLQLS